MFAGCGGSSLGFRRAGFRILAAIDNDPTSAKSYEKNLGVSPLVEDVRTVTGRRLLLRAGIKKGELTALIGCPPCQGFTSHRRDTRAGWDKRNRLLDEYIRLVEEIDPHFVVFENVPGLANGPGHWRLMQAIRRLKKLGYGVAYEVLEAADYGTPQQRSRLLVIASRDHDAIELPPRTHGKPNKKSVRTGKLQPWQTVRDAIGGLPKLRSGATNGSDKLHAARNHSKTNLERLRAIPHDGGSRDALPPRLVLACHKNHDGHRDVYGRMRWNRPAPTLTSGCTNMTRGRFAHPAQDRAITVREALLLQGFPKYARLDGNIEEQSLQVGNAVPPPFAAAAARAVRRMAAKPTKPARHGSARGHARVRRPARSVRRAA